MLTLGKLHDKLLDKCGHILVGDNFAFPFLDIEGCFIDMDFHVAFHFHLASETPVVFNLTASEMHSLCGQHIAAAFKNLHFALAAAAFSAAG